MRGRLPVPLVEGAPGARRELQPMGTLLACLPAPQRLHQKARHEHPPGYPERFPVPDDRVPWAVAFPEYRPPVFTDPRLLAQPWADPEWSPSLARFVSLEGELARDDQGRPLNPWGRTGLAGRGRLGRHGANFSADPILTRVREGALETVLIQRRDCGQWAIPGGMVDQGEDFRQAARRELLEETGLGLDFGPAVSVARGYVDDPRNTDHAWMESEAFHLHLNQGALQPVGGDDAREAAWVRVDRALMDRLYASHWVSLARAVGNLERLLAGTVREDGTIL